MLCIAILDIQRWRYIHIILYICSRCVSCNGLSIGRTIIFTEHSWQHILSSKPLDIKITDQTNRMVWKAGSGTSKVSDPSGRYRSATPDWKLVSWGGEQNIGTVYVNFFLGGPPPQRGLEGKKTVLGFPEVSRRNREREKRYIYTTRLAAIY
jgi:hypothetical protein